MLTKLITNKLPLRHLEAFITNWFLECGLKDIINVQILIL